MQSIKKHWLEEIVDDNLTISNSRTDFNGPTSVGLFPPSSGVLLGSNTRVFRQQMQGCSEWTTVLQDLQNRFAMTWCRT